MSNDEWRPLGAEEDEGFQGLVDGVPDWLAPSFWEWAAVMFEQQQYMGYGVDISFNEALLRRAERVCRFSVGWVSEYSDENMSKITAVVTAAGLELRLADFLLSSVDIPSAGANLSEMLTEAGSAWTVGHRAGRRGLVRRVESGVQQAAEDVMTKAGHAGLRLAEAWTAAFGLNPDASRAYSLAVKAVEDAAIPVVLPRDASATLGKVIARLRDVPHQFAVPRERADVTSAAVLLSMLSLLWNGQGDRHGGSPDVSVSISRADAESAVLLAVPLVQLFASESVTRVP